MQYNNLTQFVKAKQQWDNTRSVIHPTGEVTFYANGKQVTLQEYLAHNSQPVYMPPVAENPDGTCVQGGHVTRRKR